MVALWRLFRLGKWLLSELKYKGMALIKCPIPDAQLDALTTRNSHAHSCPGPLFTFMHWRRKWQPTPVFLPGESQGGGAWWAAVYGVAQSRTRLKWLSSSRIASIIQSRASKQIKHILICLELIPLCTTTYKSTKFLLRQEVNSSHFFHALVGKKYLYLSHEEWQIPHMWVHRDADLSGG